jgi:glycosyltransferase involved in cell wall biosynthesis
MSHSTADPATVHGRTAMRVALVSLNAWAGDAIGNQVAEKLALFLDRGADVRVFLASDHHVHPAVRPHCQVLSGPEPLPDARDFLTGADLVIAEYGQHYPLLGLLPVLAGGKPRLLIDYHGVTPPNLWGTHNREALETGLRQRGLVWCADAVIVHSRFTRRDLLGHTQFPEERCHQVGFPIDPNLAAPDKPKADWRRRLGLENATVLLFVGRLAPNKGVPVLVRALARLRGRAPAVHALLAGDTGDLYAAEAARCRDLARELGVADRLHFIGHLNGVPLRDAYGAADVFVTPSRWESFCIPVIEAMACGLPVVAARAAALPETVAAAGLNFTPDDPDDLARQVLRVLGSGTTEGPVAAVMPAEVGFESSASQAACVELPSPPQGGRGDGGEGGRTLPGPQTPSPPSPLPRSGGEGRREGLPGSSQRPLRVAVVSFRYGRDFVGGAETSLRTMAEALQTVGHAVEVFTTCAQAENHWTDQRPEGTTQTAGIPVHHFRVDPHDPWRHQQAMDAIVHAGGPIPPAAEEQYLRNSVHSTRLVEEVRRRADGFDAILTGPYLFGLSCDVAREFPDRTVLVPCFHDEPLARLQVWRHVYGRVAGLLFHSPEEQALAQADLGLNCPGAACVGIWLDVEPPGDAEGGRQRVGADRYLVYCGRYVPPKGLPTLLEFARRYHEDRGGRFMFAFLGQGELAIPRTPWARDLGFVGEQAKRDVLAGASALGQLSRCESLSLAALEAWAQGVPVLADSQCEVLAGHLARCEGGRAVESYEEFAAALDDLWERPAHWQALGQRGREYVRTRYGSREAFAARLEEALRTLELPLAERMRQAGLRGAAEYTRSRWREQFAGLVEQLLDTPPRPHRESVEVRPRAAERAAAPGAGTVLVPVQVANRGTHAVVADGPGRFVLRARVVPAGRPADTFLDGPETPLPGLLMPGHTLAAAVPVPVPNTPGTYDATFRAIRAEGPSGKGREGPAMPPVESGQPLRLVVAGEAGQGDERCCAPLLASVHEALAEAHRLRRLPDTYTDVTTGWLASWKRWVKRKLLGNFQRAYVDVLSRQQSAYNQQVLTALNELAECCATLESAAAWERSRAERPGGEVPLAELVHELARQLEESRRRCAALERRLKRLEVKVRRRRAQPPDS